MTSWKGLQISYVPFAKCSSAVAKFLQDLCNRYFRSWQRISGRTVEVTSINCFTGTTSSVGLPHAIPVVIPSCQQCSSSWGTHRSSTVEPCKLDAVLPCSHGVEVGCRCHSSIVLHVTIAQIISKNEDNVWEAAVSPCRNCGGKINLMICAYMT